MCSSSAMPKKKKKNAAPVSTSLEECYSEGEVKCSSVCDTSQEDSGIQDGEKSGECTELTSTSIVLDVTGEPSTDEGNETLAESSMPEGVELDTGEEAMGEEEKPVGPPSFLDVVPSYDSVTVSHPDEEEGEAEPTTVKYKPEKLVCFPGFNDRIPRGLKDESQKYNLPPMQPCHQMSEFLRFMNQNKAEAYKKKKLKDSELRSKTPPLSIEMEVEECEGKAEDIVFNPPLPDEDPPPPPPPDTEDSASTKRVHNLLDILPEVVKSEQDESNINHHFDYPLNHHSTNTK
ncbi:Zinc finger CCHC domain-containing protein 8 [Portunus trituberculatus]|uniref:Zinc finger CCHC domain-containing protein 8 n=1 Tax=Portunus trituberculatus TaxID=210409 RepID=A0A5B7D3E1_PORTR|nr:Zinc finger CCHC domain-containing protein 8 [Portunus trituberculatus]